MRRIQEAVSVKKERNEVTSCVRNNEFRVTKKILKIKQNYIKNKIQKIDE